MREEEGRKDAKAVRGRGCEEWLKGEGGGSALGVWERGAGGKIGKDMQWIKGAGGGKALGVGKRGEGGVLTMGDGVKRRKKAERIGKE